MHLSTRTSHRLRQLQVVANRLQLHCRVCTHHHTELITIPDTCATLLELTSTAVCPTTDTEQHSETRQLPALQPHGTRPHYDILKLPLALSLSRCRITPP
jgi:hypothetical protein